MELTAEEAIERVRIFIRDFLKANQMEMRLDGERPFLKGKDTGARSVLTFLDEMFPEDGD